MKAQQMTWRGRSPTQWLLIACFVIVATVTAVAVVRTVREVRFWNAHRDEPIEGWMSIGFVAHSYHVPPYVLEQAIGLPPGPPPDHRRLARIAADTGVPLATLKARLLNAIVHVRPPYPPPGPPPPRQPPGTGKPASSAR
ncbi:conserved hypothetical protein [Sphingomonas sp. EC-HK361]|uniref:hypothetical protein n=1 Tax=Sphingomonas sp. EC-HK361 TaxID=2038397 RepID=UPI001258197B|nr:hypothetical protein [Sphingomonas sp. EC-HK361]VVT10587.1 conserved hypothetical protein [Sphingomonas sp. EC-HK361]